jgi:Putative Ig domain
LGKTIKTIATSAGFLFLLQCLGCGPGTTQQADNQQPAASPNITQVLPQTIPAGSQSMTLKVTGTNFSPQAAILWNGAALSTTVVDANTLSGIVGSSSLATPTTVQLQVQNTQTMQSSQAVPVTITGASAGPSTALSISIASLPQGVVGSSYSGNFTAVGGASPYTWSVSAGQLPPGLSLSSTTGALSGTPTASGNYSFGIKVIDSSSSVQSASTTVSLPVVTATATPTPLSITTTSIPSGTIGSAYSTVLVSNGGAAPYAWSITAGGLPNGLSLSATTGLISGTPTAVGTTHFTAAIADSSNPAQTKSVSLTLVVAPTQFGITTSSLPSSTIGSTYTSLLQATGGTAPYAWSIASGSLPAGLSLTAATGIISGTPTTAGTFTFTATAADAGTPAQTKSVSLSIVIAPVTLAITSSALPSGTQSSSYTGTLQATGGTGAYTWSIASGTLPAGLSLAPATGVVSGTPTSSGNSSFKVAVTDTGSPAQTATATIALSIVAAGTPLAVSTTTLPAGKPNKNYTATLNATGGTSPYTWSITSGTLPSGLSLATATGIISGKATASSTTSLTFQVTDSSTTPQTKSVTLSLVIAPPALTITSSTLSPGTKGTSYSSVLAATGGTTPYTWSVTAGSLPAGLSLAPSTGLISGTPTATGTTNFTVTVADAGNPVQSASVAVSIVVAAPAPPALAITTSSMPAGTNGTSYSNALQASGGTSPYAWSISAGSLPAGLSLNQATGLISGTPTANGTSSFTATVTDGGSPAQTKSVPLSIAVAAGTASALTISAALSAATVNTGYSSAMTATGGTPAYTWSISAGSLPPGLTLAATTGTISGNPSASGTYNFTATVGDNGSPVQTKSAATSIVVAAATPPGSGTIWHIRQDGGNNVQCTGTTNAAYPGSGTGMPCAYNHPFQMLNSSGNWTSFASGDTMEFDDPPTNTTPYYIGEQNGGLGSDWNGQIAGACPSPNSPAAAGASCILPILPSEVTIRGQNYGNCHNADHSGLNGPTILSGINGVFAVLRVQGTSNVTISCIEVTQPDTCTTAGTGQGPGQCTSTSNYVGYAGLMLAYQTNQGPANMTLTDFAVVGASSRGIMGSHINLLSTDTFTASDIYVIGNGQAGWDGDGGGCNNSCESVGTMNLSYLDIEWNGCMAVKPYNIGISPETAPNAFNYCYGQNTSGYGDGFVQLAAGNLNLNIDHSKSKYNTQDGFDMTHLSDDPNTSPAIRISDSWAEGNAGQTFKIGAGASSTAINNVSISNCHILSNTSAFPNNPTGWVALDGGDTCRAAGDEWALTLRPNMSITLQNNTSLGYGTVMYDIECSPFVSNCNGGTVVFTNNLSKGYPDPSNAQQLASGLYFGPNLSSTIVTASNNLWSTMRTGCPDSAIPGETNYVCADPLLAGESNIDAINPSLTSASPAIGAGTPISGITTDFNGVTRPNPPSIGAQEPPQSPH